ncbi:hypothetical protein D3C76_1872250 [compost metagenome]
MFGVGIGEGIYLAMQPDPFVKGGTQGTGQRSLDEVPQQIAGEGAVGVGGQMQVSQIVHGGGR